MTTSILSVDEFGEQASAIAPRFVDVWVLPAVVMYLAWAAKAQPKIVRRIAFGGGIYMIYRNWKRYGEDVKALSAVVTDVNKA
jgi:hypothetical protein